MKKIGITGGIGCGKSEVCRYLHKKHGAFVILADNVGHEVMEPGTQCYEKLKAIFGDEYLLQDGKLNRKKIGDIAFKDKTILERMNSIIHPAVQEKIFGMIEEAKKAGVRLLVIESALLIGSVYADICDEIWYVYSDREVRIERLLSSRDITREKAELIMKKQLSEAEFNKESDFILNNSFEFEKTAEKIDKRLAEGVKI